MSALPPRKQTFRVRSASPLSAISGHGQGRERQDLHLAAWTRGVHLLAQIGSLDRGISTSGRSPIDAFMSALGHLRRFRNARAISALPAIATDIGLQILFDRGISDRYVDQCPLKVRDEFVVFGRIDGDATVASPQDTVILGAKTSGRVPV